MSWKEKVMREFDPDNPMMRRELREANDEGGATLGAIGLFAALVVAVMVGLYFWNSGDRASTTATNTAPGVTTGSSTTTPPAPPSQSGSDKPRLATPQAGASRLTADGSAVLVLWAERFAAPFRLRSWRLTAPVRTPSPCLLVAEQQILEREGPSGATVKRLVSMPGRVPAGLPQHFAASNEVSLEM
jgi:hypothetical protein